MFKTYNDTLRAYEEHLPKNYDSSQGAWVDSPSAKTYDSTEAAWIERLYQGYFTLRQDAYNPKLSDNDELVVTKNEVTLFTVKNTETRFIVFDFPLKWAGDTVEFELVSNGVAKVSVGMKFAYGTSGGTVSGAAKSVSDVYDGIVSVYFGELSDTYEGQPITSSSISVEIYVTAEKANSDTGYVNIRNLKINGKKYGFTE
jgi:hypothetical protein